MSDSRLPVRRRHLAVGDLCFTRNSRTSPRNNGLLVVIIQIARRPDTNPYRIRRIDGQPFPVLGPVKGPHQFDTAIEAVTTARHLKRIEPDARDPRDLQVVQSIVQKLGRRGASNTNLRNFTHETDPATLAR